MDFPSKKLLASLIATVILTGCAVGRSELNIQVPAGQAAQNNGKQVYVNAITDQRAFQVKPPSPDIPSLDTSGDQTEGIKSRAIGRKRNGYGMALGDIVLQQGETVQSITQKSIQEAFAEKGYLVINNKDQVTKDTYVVDASINKFWAWMNPGFVAITLSSEISTDLTIKSGDTTTPQNVSVKAANSFGTGVESNWIEVIQKSLRLYIDELKSKLD